MLAIKSVFKRKHLFVFVIFSVFLGFFGGLCSFADSIVGHSIEGKKWVTFFIHSTSYLRKDGKRVSGIASKYEGFKKEFFISGPVLVTDETAYEMEQAFLNELELNDFGYSSNDTVWYREFDTKRKCALFIQNEKAKAKREGYIIHEFRSN